jgi:dTDP-4-amino-4,6-dideoxygalactose transaminase
MSGDRTNGKIIGGKFGLEPDLAAITSHLPVLKDHMICMLGGRCCIRLLVEHLRPGRVWMPSYLCPTMVTPLATLASEVTFYEVDGQLSITDLRWLEEVGRGDLVVFVDYFGFPCPRERVRDAAARGAWVLEDACPAMLSEGVGRDAHFLLYSPRKLVGVADGGILTYDDGIDLSGTALEKPPVEWWIRVLEGMVLRREFDRGGQDRRWFPLLQEAAATFPLGNYAMSELSQTLFFHGFDYAEIAKRRVRNYSVLLSHLRRIAIFKELPSGVVPLGFPIRVKRRDALRQVLCDKEIYPPVHWLLKDVVPGRFAASHQLAAEILTLPCDQRYDTDDMERVRRAVLEALDS